MTRVITLSGLYIEIWLLRRNPVALRIVQRMLRQLWNLKMARRTQGAKLRKLKHYIETLCGIYSRIARRLGVDRTYVSRVAKGERRSPQIEAALIQEFDRSRHKVRD